MNLKDAPPSANDFSDAPSVLVLVQVVHSLEFAGYGQLTFLKFHSHLFVSSHNKNQFLHILSICELYIEVGR